MLEIAGGTRPRTLKAYVSQWLHFEQFLERTKGYSWPKGPSDIVDYLHFRGSEPCGPSVPDGILMALRFIDKTSGLQEMEKFSLL